MLHARSLIGLGLGIALFCRQSATVAQDLGDFPVLYETSRETTWTVGCYPPCRCPIAAAQGLHGQFFVEEIDASETSKTYALTELSWTVPGQLAETITGSGTLQIQRIDAEPDGELVQRLVLELRVDAVPAERYDSGPLPFLGEFPDAAPPEIDATVSLNGMVCFDQTLRLVASPSPEQRPIFLRGDCNTDGNRDIGDAILTLLSIFNAGAVGEVPCLAACDADDNEQVQLTDAIFLLNWLFRGGSDIPEPSSACGFDPTEGIGCEEGGGCL